jgi:regulator of protease activity HflC (stomatin/prohibitin superfamily)
MSSSDLTIFKWIAIALVSIILFAIFFPFIIIGAGERSVVTRFGVINRTLDPGLHWITPIVERNTDYSIRTQKEVIKASASSKDLQDVTTEVALNYNINPSFVNKLYVAVKSDYQNILIDPALSEAVKASTAKYTASELITKREQVTKEILADVQKGLLERSGNI